MKTSEEPRPAKFLGQVLNFPIPPKYNNDAYTKHQKFFLELIIRHAFSKRIQDICILGRDDPGANLSEFLGPPVLAKGSVPKGANVHCLSHPKVASLDIRTNRA